MNIPTWFVLVLVAIVGFFVLALLWGRIGTTIKGLLKGVLIVGILLGGGFFVAKLAMDPFERAVWANRVNSTQAYVTAWLEDNFGVQLPASGLVFNPPPQAAPEPEKPVNLETLSASLPRIPVQVKTYFIADLPEFKGNNQKTVEVKDVIVAVSGVVSPTLSASTTTTTTVQLSNVVTDSMPARFPITGTVVAQIYKDGAVILSGRPFTEVVQGWLQSVQRAATPIVELDEQPDSTRRIAKDAPVRRELRETMNSLKLLFDFQPELLVEVGVAKAEEIPHFAEAQATTSRIRLASFAVDQCSVSQAPRGIDEGGTPALRGLVECFRSKFYTLDARRVELGWNLKAGDEKQEVDGWPQLQREAALTLAAASKLLDLMKIEVGSSSRDGKPLDPLIMADIEKVYNRGLFELLIDTGRKLTALRLAVEAP